MLRDLKRTAAMPNEESLHAMTGHLNSLAVALASGNFDRWPMPQSAIPVTPVKRPLWWRLMQIGRTTLVIIGPPLVAFLVPHVAPVTGPGLGWLQSASLVWALLAAVVALDPALSDRIAKMRAMLSLLRDAMPPGGVGTSPATKTLRIGPSETYLTWAPDQQLRPGETAYHPHNTHHIPEGAT